MRKSIVTLTIGVLLATTAAQPSAAASVSYVKEFGLGMAAIGTNLLYAPAKMFYAVSGCLVGALGLAVTGGNLEAAHYIWSPSIGGTWVVTPAMLAGEQPILFVGESFERGNEQRD